MVMSAIRAYGFTGAHASSRRPQAIRLDANQHYWSVYDQNHVKSGGHARLVALNILRRHAA